MSKNHPDWCSCKDCKKSSGVDAAAFPCGHPVACIRPKDGEDGAILQWECGWCADKCATLPCGHPTGCTTRPSVPCPKCGGGGGHHLCNGDPATCVECGGLGEVPGEPQCGWCAAEAEVSERKHRVRLSKSIERQLLVVKARLGSGRPVDPLRREQSEEADLLRRSNKRLQRLAEEWAERVSELEHQLGICSVAPQMPCPRCERPPGGTDLDLKPIEPMLDLGHLEQYTPRQYRDALETSVAEIKKLRYYGANLAHRMALWDKWVPIRWGYEDEEYDGDPLDLLNYPTPEEERLQGALRRLGCHAQKDGDCSWEFCPQLRDGEPAESGRHCPLDYRDYEEM